jgi:recombinase
MEHITMNFTNQIQEAAIYCRVSTDDQAERGTIESQIEYAEKYCDLNGIRIVKIYRDDGITGTLPLEERPAGAELLADAKEGVFSTLLVFKLDRLGRVTRIIINAIYELEQYGVKLKSMTEPFDTSDPSGRFLLTILAGVADLERSNILQRMQLGANRAAAAGKWLGGIVPYGYIVNDDRFLEVNETEIPGTGMSEADVIRLIFHLIAEEKMSSIAVADRLNSLGIPPSYVLRGIKGKRRKNTRGVWRTGRVICIAKNTLYYGVHRYGKRSPHNREIIEREVPAIVSKEVWDVTQEVLHSNQIMSARNAKNTYLLRGLIKCASCGSTYSGVSSKGARYYLCNGKRLYKAAIREKCFAHSFSMDWIDNEVWNDCMKYINQPNLIVEAIEEHQGKEDESAKQIRLLEVQLAECESERERIMDMYRTKLISFAEVEKQLGKSADKKSAIEFELSVLKSRHESTSIPERKEAALDILNEIKKKLTSAEEISIDLKFEVIHILVKKITAISTDTGVTFKVHYAFGDLTQTVNRTVMDSLPLPK